MASHVEERTLPAGDDRTLSRVCGELYCQLIDRTRPPWHLTVLHGYRDETRQVRKAVGGTVNDLVLAILSGALGRYMRRHGYPTQGRELQALCPVSVRATDQSGAMGNQVSMIVVPLPVGTEDGRARLHAVRSAMAELKRRRQADGIHEVIAGANWWPAPLYRLVWKLWPRGYFPLHITSTNVPGPRQPLCPGPEAGWRAVRSQ